MTNQEAVAKDLRDIIGSISFSWHAYLAPFAEPDFEDILEKLESCAVRLEQGDEQGES